ncbi:MAG TPA: hypothetical protein VGB17_12750 [Pyrinomonadaceae bacterium]|jgi:cell division protein FtsL
MIYAALIIGLSLACVVAVQCGYMIFVQVVSYHDRKRIEELERRLRRTERELFVASRELEKTEERLAETLNRQTDVWPEIIDG